MTKTMRTAAQTAALMAVLTLISKCFGFAREMVMANFFGTSYITDAYVMAQSIPGIIFGGILGAVSISYMPLLSKTLEEEGDIKANELTSGVLNILAVVSAISAIIGILLSDQIVAFFARGFTGETAELTSFFLKITFFYLIFSATADILEAFLRHKGIFLPQVAFGFIQNIILISTIVISAMTSYYYLAFGYLLVYIIRLIVMWRIAKKMDFRYVVSKKLHGSVSKIITLAFPVFIGNGMTQINAFVDKTLASGLPEGSVSALNYSNLLINMIIGLTVTIMTTIIYPKLTQASALGDSERLSNIASTGMTLIVIIAAPCSLGAMVYSHQVVQIVYERGAFNSVATNMTASAFLYYAIGLLFVSMNILITQVYYSKHNMRTPVIFGAIGVIINIVFSLLLVQSMAHSGLALATSIAAISATILLLIGLKKKYPEISLSELKQKIIKVIFAAFVAVGLSYAFYILIITKLGDLIVPRVLQLFLAISVAGVIYLFLLWMMKMEELGLIKQIRR